MITRILHHSKHAVLMTLVMTVVLGGVIPFVFTAISHILFPSASHGSLIEKDGKVIGSELLGQDFTSPRYFKGRLSATTPPYNASMSGASNLSMNNALLLDRANLRLAQFPTSTKIPISLITSSGSGLDPHISLAAAYFQAPHIAKARGLKLDTVRELIIRTMEPPYLGFIGSSRVNVLQLNMSLDGLNGK